MLFILTNNCKKQTNLYYSISQDTLHIISILTIDINRRNLKSNLKNNHNCVTIAILYAELYADNSASRFSAQCIASTLVQI